jgi:alpha 1,2-mannosyltransferase
LEEARPLLTSVGAYDQVYTASSEEMEGLALDWNNVLTIPEENILLLAKSHDTLRSRIDSNQIVVPIEKSENGIVIVADKGTLPNVLLQLRLLRHMKTTSRVEVFLRSYDDYDTDLCQNMFKLLQAECRIMEEFFDIAPLPRMPEQFLRRILRTNEPLHKLLAVFFSSFQNVLVIGHDVLPANRADDIFITEPFLSTGLVLWPDFWANTESTLLAKIQARPASSSYKNEDIRSVDMSQALISKKKQGKTLLYAIYYMIFGRDLYDPLSRQGNQGQRDANLIAQGAKAAESPYYICRRFTEAIGFPEEYKNGEHFKGVAVLQSHPMDDYHGVNKWGQRPLFIKQDLIPGTILQTDFFITEKTQVHHRMWEWFGARDRMRDWETDDPERFIWQELEFISCKEYKQFSHWPADEAKQACYTIKAHIDSMGWKDRAPLVEVERAVVKE